MRSRAIAIVDEACERVFRSALAAADRLEIVELRVRFPRPFAGAEGALTCVARAGDVGEHVGTAHAEITDSGGRVFVEADATCLVRRASSSSR